MILEYDNFLPNVQLKINDPIYIWNNMKKKVKKRKVVFVTNR